MNVMGKDISLACKKFFFPEASPDALALLRVSLGLIVLLELGKPNYFANLSNLPNLLWQPISIWRFFSSPPLTESFLQFLHLIFLTTNLALLFGWKTRVSAALCFGIGFLEISYFQSFGYYPHNFLPWIFIYAFLALGSGRSQTCGWALQNTRILFCLIFFGAGYSKLTLGGAIWWETDHLGKIIYRALLLHHDVNNFSFLGNSLHLWIIEQKILLKFLGALTIALELLTPLLLFLPRIRLPWLLCLAIFQLSVLVLLRVRFTTYLPLYVAWLPLTLNTSAIFARGSSALTAHLPFSWKNPSKL